eukprot:CAMPEP_0175361996 /NCGR_PEP_ID=MMETSP0095-20121207/16848_1 /TAXON_ID=311494 /ORGANISM="Alexandrium monilatum, Strain CCMP3105" /LENGTH=57 /DNA_ID=CAMNT_0016659867 /DNA_START=35 /DNA_END=204 /DNA_ORIENTATION=-
MPSDPPCSRASRLAKLECEQGGGRGSKIKHLRMPRETTGCTRSRIQKDALPQPHPWR